MPLTFPSGSGAPLRFTMPLELLDPDPLIPLWLAGANAGVAGLRTNMELALSFSVNRPTEGWVVIPSWAGCDSLNAPEYCGRCPPCP